MSTEPTATVDPVVTPSKSEKAKRIAATTAIHLIPVVASGAAAFFGAKIGVTSAIVRGSASVVENVTQS